LMYTKDGYEQVFFRAKNFTFEAAAIALWGKDDEFTSYSYFDMPSNYTVSDYVHLLSYEYKAMRTCDWIVETWETARNYLHICMHKAQLPVVLISLQSS
jgi:hypothetical protein